MQLLWVIAAICCVGLVASDAGYSYPSPVNSHSFNGHIFSSPGYSLASDGHLPSLAHRSQFSDGYSYPAPNPSSQFAAPSNSAGFVGDLTSATEAPIQVSKSDTILSGGFSGDGLVPTTPAPLLINKHVYFFAGRDPPTTRTQPTAGGDPSSRKMHYKIVFIKAPSYQAQTQQVGESQVRDEHKTLIYVLVKKPEEAAASLATPALTAPSRPEVYFIRYKTRAQAAGHAHGSGDGSGTSYGVPERAGGPGTSYGVPERAGGPGTSYGVPKRAGGPGTSYGVPARVGGPY